MSDAALGTASDICLAEAVNVEAVSDTCPLGRSVLFLLSDAGTAADGEVTRLSALPAELSDAAPATFVAMSVGCV